MSESNSTLRHPSHRPADYSFRSHYYIPHTYTTNVFHSYRKQNTGLKWAGQLITQIWKLIYGQWIHHSKFNHTGEALDDHAKYLILDAKIIEEYEQVQDTLTYCYSPYFGT